MRSAAGTLWFGLVLLLHAIGSASAPALPAAAAPAEHAEHAMVAPVLVVTIDGAIGPATADHLHRALALAARQQAQLLVLRLDTPGGLEVSMRSIIQDILASPVPVAAFVAPNGARAASAGTYLLYASHIAAMSPVSNLGAATPVAIGLPLAGGTAASEPAADALAAKHLSDASAALRSLAQLRGRNAEWAEQAVRAGASLSAAEALRLRVVDLIAQDVPDLLRQLDGRVLALPDGERHLATRAAPVLPFEADWRNRLLALIADPSLALILMMVGFYGLLFEFSNPGFVLPGVIGAISLLLGLFALQMLPVSMAGLGLLLLGLAFLAAEAFLPSFGALGLGGLLAFALGAVLLIDSDAPGFGIPVALIAALTVGSAAFIALLASMAARARRRPLVGGTATLLGADGELLEFSAGRGWALLQGEPWRVQGDERTEALRAGARVRVSAVRGAVLEIVAEPAQRPEGVSP